MLRGARFRGGSVKGCKCFLDWLVCFSSWLVVAIELFLALGRRLGFAGSGRDGSEILPVELLCMLRVSTELRADRFLSKKYGPAGALSLGDS